jgi:hypothetical protein
VCEPYNRWCNVQCLVGVYYIMWRQYYSTSRYASCDRGILKPTTQFGREHSVNSFPVRLKVVRPYPVFNPVQSGLFIYDTKNHFFFHDESQLIVDDLIIKISHVAIQ